MHAAFEVAIVFFYNPYRNFKEYFHVLIVKALLYIVQQHSNDRTMTILLDGL